MLKSSWALPLFRGTEIPDLVSELRALFDHQLLHQMEYLPEDRQRKVRNVGAALKTGIVKWLHGLKEDLLLLRWCQMSFVDLVEHIGLELTNLTIEGMLVELHPSRTSATLLQWVVKKGVRLLDPYDCDILATVPRPLVSSSVCLLQLKSRAVPRRLVPARM